jgi:tRNA dimethylallyltransferase
LSAWHASPRAAHHNPLPPGALLSLEPTDRAWLHERIATRYTQMLDAGFLDEVRSLRARGDLQPELPAMRCVGYRQAWAWLDAVDAGTPQPLSALIDTGVAATRQLAKRQLTWLRSMPERQVVACDSLDATDQVMQRVDSLWGQP